MTFDGRQPISCPDCGATVQPVRMHGNLRLRCPWAASPTWFLDTNTEPYRIYCRWPMGVKRHPGGIRAAP